MDELVVISQCEQNVVKGVVVSTGENVQQTVDWGVALTVQGLLKQIDEEAEASEFDTLMVRKEDWDNGHLQKVV